MGLTERHLFEDEEPELTENQLEDRLWENNKIFERGYQKGFSDGKEVAIVRCKDCKHRPSVEGKTYYTGFDLHFPDHGCPCQCEADGFYSWMPADDWFCANGERR